MTILSVKNLTTQFSTDDGEVRAVNDVSFDLSKGPLFRVSLFTLGWSEHVLLMNMHHIISDGWSLGILTRELSALYSAFRAARPSPLPDLPIQYVDFSCWQRRWLTGEVLERQLGYWRDQLAGLSPLEMPTDKPRPPALTGQGSLCRLSIGRELADSLKELSRREGSSLFMTLLTGFSVLLSRYSGQSDIAVGSPIANRNQPEVEGLIGFFVNTLVMRTDLSDNPTFTELLGRVREVALVAYNHQDLPFEKLVEELQPERSLNRHPLFQVMFVFQNNPSARLEMEGLVSEVIELGGMTAKFDLLLAMAESPSGLEGAVEYSTDLYDGSTVERLAGHFVKLLAAVAAAPDRRVSELPLMDEEETALTVVG